METIIFCINGHNANLLKNMYFFYLIHHDYIISALMPAANLFRGVICQQIELRNQRQRVSKCRILLAGLVFSTKTATYDAANKKTSQRAVMLSDLTTILVYPAC